MKMDFGSGLSSQFTWRISLISGDKLTNWLLICNSDRYSNEVTLFSERDGNEKHKKEVHGVKFVSKKPPGANHQHEMSNAL